MGVFSNTKANAYADTIKAVYEYLGEVRKVGSRLTLVEDLTSFQLQIDELYTRLDLLVEASEIIVTATPIGEEILTGTYQSIHTLLNIPTDWVTHAELDAAIDGIDGTGGGGGGGDLDGILGSITTINILITELDQYRLIQQASLTGFEINYQNLAAGLETNQANTELVLQRLTVQEQYATLVDQRLESIDQEMISTVTGLQASNSTISGHTALIQTAFDSISILATSVDALESSLIDTQNDITANTSALSYMQTVITGLGNDIVAGSQQVVSLKSVIGGSGNLLPNADFSVGANGWSIVVAEDDWALSVLEMNAWNTPDLVNCLSVLGQPTPLGQIVIESPAMLLVGGNHYIVSGYPCVDNGTIALSYKVFDADNSVVGQGVCPATFNVTTNPNFSNYTRTWVKFLASIGAVKMRLYLTITGDGDWIVQAGLFRPMVERAWADQIGPSEWTSNISGVADALSEALQTLTTETTSINGELSALSIAQTSLLSRVGTVEGALVDELITRANQYGSLVSSVNTLSANMVDVQDSLDIQSTAITGLLSSVSTINGVITSHSNSLTSIQAQIDSLDQSTGGSGAAISALDARVTATEGSITSMTSAITSLQSSVTSANKIFAQNDPPSTIGRTSGDLWIDINDGNKMYVLDGSVWVLRPDNTRSRIFTQDTQPTGANIGDLWIETDNGNKVWMWNGYTWADATDARTTANTSAITTLTATTSSLQGIVSSQSSSITTLTSSVEGAQSTANAAVTAAAAAQTAANTANTTLTEIASDGLLTPGEKPQVILQYNEIIDEQKGPSPYTTGLDAQATLYGATTEKSNYDAAITNLTNYLNSLTTPVLWSNLAGNTTIVGSTFRTNFASVYSYRQVLLNRIMTVTKTSLDSNASAVTSLTTEITTAKDNINIQAASITSLNSSIAGKADVSAVTALTTRVTEMQGAGQNMLVNTTFQANILNWVGEGNVTGSIVRDAFNGVGVYQPVGMHALVLLPPAVGGTGVIDSDHYYARQDFICEAGKQYIASAYMAALRGKCFVYLAWYNSAGTNIGVLITPNMVVGTGGTDLTANYTRLYLKATAPAGAVKLAVMFGWRKSVLTNDPYVWIIRPMLEEVGATQTTPSRWNAGGVEMLATYSLTLNVNGYISGFQSNNDGTTSNFNILASNFSINVPGGGPGMSWVNGTLWNKGAAYSVLMGQDMSPSTDVIFWIGPNPTSAATASKTNASFYVTETGAGWFRGTLYGSILSASALELGSTRIHVGSGRLAPFIVSSRAYKGTGTKFAGTCELNTFISPNTGSGYDSKRLARLITDVNLTLDFRGNGNSGDTQTVNLEVQYDGGTWTVIATKVVGVDNNGNWMFLIRYTTLSSWTTVKFRGRTIGGNYTVVLGIEAEVDNTYETSSAAGSVSGLDSSTGTSATATGTTSGGTGGTGGTGGSGGGGFCVVADMTYLPNGLMVADQSLGTNIACWNDDINDPDIEMHPLLAMPQGYEECFIVVTENGCSVAQSISTPIPLRDGRLVRTMECIGQEVLTNRNNILGWSTVTSLVPLGIRRVVKPDLGDRVFFAGINPQMTIATHNIAQKSDF